MSIYKKSPVMRRKFNAEELTANLPLNFPYEGANIYFFVDFKGYNLNYYVYKVSVF